MFSCRLEKRNFSREAVAVRGGGGPRRGKKRASNQLFGVLKRGGENYMQNRCWGITVKKKKRGDKILQPAASKCRGVTAVRKNGETRSWVAEG